LNFYQRNSTNLTIILHYSNVLKEIKCEVCSKDNCTIICVKISMLITVMINIPKGVGEGENVVVIDIATVEIGGITVVNGVIVVEGAMVVVKNPNEK